MNKATYMTALLLAALAVGRASTLTSGIGTADPEMMVADSSVCFGQTSKAVTSPFPVVPKTPPETDCYVNASLQDWASMDMMAPYPGGPVTNYTCDGDLFLNCKITLSADQTTLNILFSGTGVNFPGIPSGATFAIEIGSGWLSNQTITVAANVPEPSTGALIGLTLLLAWAGSQIRASGATRISRRNAFVRFTQR